MITTLLRWTSTWTIVLLAFSHPLDVDDIFLSVHLHSVANLLTCVVFLGHLELVVLAKADRPDIVLLLHLPWQPGRHGPGGTEVVFAAVLGHKEIELHDDCLPGTRWAQKCALSRVCLRSPHLLWWIMKSRGWRKWEKCPYCRYDRLWWSLIFPWRIALCCGEDFRHISQLLLFLFSCQSQEGLFLRISPWGPSGFPGGKAQESARPHKTLTSRSFSPIGWSNSVSSSLSKLPFKCSYQFMVPGISALRVNRSQLWLFGVTCLDFGVAVFPTTSVLW